MTQPSSPPRGDASGGSNPTAWIKAHQGAAVAAVAAIALGLYMRNKNAAAAAGTPGATSSPVGAATGTTYDSTPNDVYNSLESQLGVLQTQIQTLDGGNPAANATIAQYLPGIGTTTPPAGGNTGGAGGGIWYGPGGSSGPIGTKRRVAVTYPGPVGATV